MQTPVPARIRLSATHARSRPAGNASPHAALLAAAVFAALTAPIAAQLQFEELGQRIPGNSDATSGVAIGDVDGDGDLDLVFGNNYGQQDRLWLNAGDGTFVDATASHMPASLDWSSGLALGDVDGDGDLDLVAARPSRLYLNDGSGIFTSAPVASMPVGNGITPAFGDVDGDGDLDIAFASNEESFAMPNLLYLNDGLGVFSDATAMRMPPNGQWGDYTKAVVMGDVDSDGDVDMLCANAPSYQMLWVTNGLNRLYLNDGSGTFTDATSTQMPFQFGDAWSVALADVDGDGDLDAVFGDSWASRLFVNDGNGWFSDASALQMPAGNGWNVALAFADLDGDGDPDLVSGNEAFLSSPLFAQNRFYLNDGTGTFQDVTAARLPAAFDNTRGLALGDLDSDGDIDLVFGTLGAENRVYLNLQRQLDAPLAPQIGQPYGLDAYMRYGTSNVANFAVTYLSTAPDSIATAFGTIGLDLAQAVPFPTMIVPQPTGVGSVGFTVPNTPSLVGQAIYSQAMLVAYPYDLRLSNVVADVIQ